MNNSVDVTVIGAAVMDVLAGAAGPEVFETGSMPMDFIRTSYGGDALNEAVVLSRLGRKVELITRLGNDDTGRQTLNFLSENGVVTSHSTITDEYHSPVNIVLVDDKGERYFLTDPNSCLRKLSAEDILPYTGKMADIVSFASIFVSPLLIMTELENVFKKIKEPVERNNKIIKPTLLTDVTKPKFGETLKDMEKIIPYIDFFLANEAEISMLTGQNDASENSKHIIDAGAGCAVIKRGAKGCIIRTDKDYYEIPACSVDKIIDSTGAGDSFAAGFIYGLSEGYSLADCGRFACSVASCIVEEIGAAEGITSLEKPMSRFNNFYT